MMLVPTTNESTAGKVGGAPAAGGFVIPTGRMHELKIMKQFADAIWDGSKTFEIRKNDRGFNAGDLVRFKCCDYVYDEIDHPINDATFIITYVISGWGIQERYVVFSIEEVCEGGEGE